MGEVDILVIDDQALVRDGVKRILRDAPELRVAGEASSAAEAIPLLHSRKWDLVLLDISLPGSNGLEMLQAIRQHDPRLPVLVLSLHAEEHYALRLLKAGARGYLEKQDAPGELAFAIHRVVEGGYYVGTALAERLTRDARSGGPPSSR